MKETIRITEKQARKVLEIIDAGLVSGVGNYKPGEVCVEAAVCLAFGEGPSNDAPKCVDPLLRSLKILINDHDVWGGHYKTEDDERKARANALRRLGVIQLGSAGRLDHVKFINLLVLMAIKAIKKGSELPKNIVTKLSEVLTLKGLCSKRKILEDLYDNDEYEWNDDLERLVYCVREANNLSDHKDGWIADKLIEIIMERITTPRQCKTLCEEFVQRLIPFKLPGVKWLALTEE